MRATASYSSSAGGRSAGAAPVRATRRTLLRSAPVRRATSVGFASSASSSPVRQLVVVGRHRQVLVDHAAALVEAEADDRAVLDRERDDHRPEPVGEVACEPRLRVAVGVEERSAIRIQPPAASRTSASRAAARTARPRARPTRGRRVWTCVEARDGPAGGRRGARRARRAAAPSRARPARSRAGARPSRATCSRRARRARRAPRPAARAEPTHARSERLRDALAAARAAARAPSRRASARLGGGAPRGSPTARPSSSATNDGARRRCPSRGRPSPPPRSRERSRPARAPRRSNSSQSSRSACLVGGRGGADVHGIREAVRR